MLGPMGLLLDSFWRAAAYCVRPRVIALSFLPLLIMVALALGLGYFFWDAALDTVRSGLEASNTLNLFWDWLQGMGMGGLKTVLAPLIVIFAGRAIANGRDEGVTKLLFDDSPEAGSGDGHAGRGHGKILGGGMVGTHAGDMIGEIALAIEMGADAVDIGKTIHPHPTLGESIGMAAEVAHGSCTDVPPARK